MRITQSLVELEARSSHTRTATQSTEAEIWVGERPTSGASAVVGVSEAARRLQASGRAGTETGLSSASRFLEASTAAGTRVTRSTAPPGLSSAAVIADASQTKAADGASGVDEESSSIEDNLDPQLRMLIALVERFTGRKVVLFDPRQLAAKAEAAKAIATEAAGAERGAIAENAPVGWGIEIKATRTVVEQDATNFEAQGVVVTGDGRQIAFETSLEMTAEKVSVESFEFRAGDAVRPKDPLVLNFGSGAAELSGARAPLDLDGDGQLESLPLVTRQSALLVDDRNGNHELDDGSELFGPATGNGFSELRALDDDQNGWIDEGDSAFTRLGVWFAGDEKVTSLASAGVGALYLGSAMTPFKLSSPDGSSMADLKATGVWLEESGQVHTLQQLDVYT